ncbi:MAG: tetratricopeptide repeat protein [Thermodesulfobacteriota bacterium]
MPRILFPLTLLLTLFLGEPVAAHIEKQGMPDAVAQMEYQILLEFEPDNLTVRNQLGMVYYRLEKYDEAAEQFNRVLTASPDNFDAIDGIGLLHLQAGRLAEAVQSFRRAISLNPADPLVYSHLGLALERSGQSAPAREAYARALDNLDAVPPDKMTEQLLAEKTLIQKRLRDLQPQPTATP